ncbi:ADP-ribosylglycohydrolase family protein [Streptosporangium sp. NBC_01469]|uniref:ADP-ribosylglycohydrolase family protein n=1 Tax=Streptosporangium sp. NBC_01469 TaxID=2903898 RepID=UPI002E2D20DD|nr:ADP-ribosylglycohydrolase family protein [Streptosporangium sp. NBC_01469]
MERVAGAVVGSAVGDALGAPFEFGSPGAFSTRFPTPDAGVEMCGGGGWDTGEATDDTQMAIHVAESLLEYGGLNLPDIFTRFQRWAADDPKDIGPRTEDVLTRGLPWDQAATAHYRTSHRAAGNGSLMRATPSAVYFAADGRQATMDAARRIAALTHGDPAAWEGTAIFHDLVRLALSGADPLKELSQTLAAVHPHFPGSRASSPLPGGVGAGRERVRADVAPGRLTSIGVEVGDCSAPVSDSQVWESG